MFVEVKTLMKAIKRGDAFLIYDLPSLNVEPHPHEIPSLTKNSNVATLALGSRPRQGLARVWAKKEAWGCRRM